MLEPLKAPLPVIAIMKDCLHGDEYRIMMDSTNSIYKHIEDMYINMRNQEAFPGESKELWYWCKEGTFVVPGSEEQFLKICKHLGIRVLAESYQYRISEF